MTHVCPYCERRKPEISGVAGTVTPPEADGRSVVVCDVCGQVSLIVESGARKLGPFELTQVLDAMPAELVERRARILRAFLGQGPSRPSSSGGRSLRSFL